ncbi:hypothetical protein JCM8208_002321 [Rhodotorula glutinis]
MVREVGDLSAAGAWAARVRAVVAAASAHNPEHAADIVKYGTGMCTPGALQRFDELDEPERARAFKKLEVWQNELLSGNVKRGRWGHMMPSDERSREQGRVRGVRFRQRKAARIAAEAVAAAQRANANANAHAYPDEPPPPQLVLPSQSRSRMPSPELDDDFIDWNAAWPHQDPSAAAHVPPFLNASHGFVAPSPAPAAHHYGPFPHSTTTHSYPHAANEYCPACNPWPTALPSFGTDVSTPFHPGPRATGAPGPHVLNSSMQPQQYGHARR